MTGAAPPSRSIAVVGAGAVGSAFAGPQASSRVSQ
jgi:hypothetical protein